MLEERGQEERRKEAVLRGVFFHIYILFVSVIPYAPSVLAYGLMAPKCGAVPKRLAAALCQDSDEQYRITYMTNVEQRLLRAVAAISPLPPSCTIS